MNPHAFFFGFALRLPDTNSARAIATAISISSPPSRSTVSFRSIARCDSAFRVCSVLLMKYRSVMLSVRSFLAMEAKLIPGGKVH
jgi:hypothetical protein